jgi:hypothetical protein
MEAQAPVEAFRAVLVRVVAHRQPVLSAPHGFLTEGFDCEPPVTLTLAPGANVQPPQVAVEQRILMFRGKCGHDEADQLAAVVDQPWPCGTGHRVGIGQGPGDRGNEVFLIRPHLQFAGSPDVFLRYLLQPQPGVHIPTVRRPRRLCPGSALRLAGAAVTIRMRAGATAPATLSLPVPGGPTYSIGRSSVYHVTRR